MQIAGGGVPFVNALPSQTLQLTTNAAERCASFCQAWDLAGKGRIGAESKTQSKDWPARDQGPGGTARVVTSSNGRTA